MKYNCGVQATIIILISFKWQWVFKHSDCIVDGKCIKSEHQINHLHVCVSGDNREGILFHILPSPTVLVPCSTT